MNPESPRAWSPDVVRFDVAPVKSTYSVVCQATALRIRHKSLRQLAENDDARRLPIDLVPRLPRR